MSNNWSQTVYYNGFFIDAVKGQNYGYTFKDSISLTYFDFHLDLDHLYYYLEDTGDVAGSDGITIGSDRY